MESDNALQHLKRGLQKWLTREDDPDKTYQVKFADSTYNLKVKHDDKAEFLAKIASLPFLLRPTTFEYVTRFNSLFMLINLKPLFTRYQAKSSTLNKNFICHVAKRMRTTLIEHPAYQSADTPMTTYSMIIIQKSWNQVVIIFPNTKLPLDDIVSMRSKMIHERTNLTGLSPNAKKINAEVAWEKVFIEPRIGQRILLPYCKTDESIASFVKHRTWCEQNGLATPHRIQNYYYYDFPPNPERPASEPLFDFWIRSQIHKSN